MPRNCDRPTATLAATPRLVPRAISSIAGAMSSQPGGPEQDERLAPVRVLEEEQAGDDRGAERALRAG